MEIALRTIKDIAGQAYLIMAIISGAVISYFVFGMPLIRGFQQRLQKLVKWRSKSALARLEFFVLMAFGLLVVLFLVHPGEPQSAFISGFSWYSLLSTQKERH